jgi:hypothetical protein
MTPNKKYTLVLTTLVASTSSYFFLFLRTFGMLRSIEFDYEVVNNKRVDKANSTVILQYLARSYYRQL